MRGYRSVVRTLRCVMLHVALLKHPAGSSSFYSLSFPSFFPDHYFFQLFSLPLSKGHSPCSSPSPKPWSKSGKTPSGLFLWVGTLLVSPQPPPPQRLPAFQPRRFYSRSDAGIRNLSANDDPIHTKSSQMNLKNRIFSGGVERVLLQVEGKFGGNQPHFHCRCIRPSRFLTMRWSLSAFLVSTSLLCSVAPLARLLSTFSTNESG